MGDKSKINWTDATWNPVTGCSKISPGCGNCYAEKMARRLQAMGAERYKDGFAVRCHEDALMTPLRWRRPRRIFVNSMSDLFHDEVPCDFIYKVFAMMALARWHTFMILTKRPERMHYLLTEYREKVSEKGMWMDVLSRAAYDVTTSDEAECHVHNAIEGCLGNGHNLGWPLRNVWLGVTAENQKEADRRLPILASTPAARRFISCEPLLEQISLLHGANTLDWIIVGGESGPKARDIKVEWVRSLRDQARSVGAAFFFKQWSAATMYQVIKDNGLPAFDGKTYGEIPPPVEDTMDSNPSKRGI